jgi:hypothetical protein
VHKLPGDLREALLANPSALDAWKDITPLARNEFICWVEDAKQDMTRERRIRRSQEELEEGQRRPCCWPGCKHRERNGGEPTAGDFARRCRSAHPPMRQAEWPSAGVEDAARPSRGRDTPTSR